MKKEIIKEMVIDRILNECNDEDKKLIKLHKDLFIKIYKKGIKEGFNFAQTCY